MEARSSEDRGVTAADPAWHATTAAEAATRLETDLEKGLSPGEATTRIQKYGPNVLPEVPGPSPWRQFFGQFANLLVVILLIAAVIAGAMGEVIDAVAIVSIVVLNAIVGFVQERNAANALAALRNLSAPTARVKRGGETRVVPAAELVPGDLVVLEAGDRIPADLRLVSASELKCSEAALTGESEPVDKDPAAAIAAGASLGDRATMAWTATTVAAGLGEGLVVTTGGKTEFGRIAELMRSAEEEETPLQARLRVFGKWLVYACLAVVTLVFVLGLVRGVPPLTMFLTSVSLAVAAVPEGLPAVVTIALALGVWRLAKRNALVRRLASVETLGATSVICTDKTGTLTLGRMTLRVVAAPGAEVEAGAALTPALREILNAAAASSTARILENGECAGDPTEGAILTAAAKAGIEITEAVASVRPFDSSRKRMSVTRGNRIYVKGAPESVLPICTMAEGDRAAAGKLADELAQRGLRVLAAASRDAGGGDPESGLQFHGFLGLQDPPRAEAKSSVAACHGAGIRVVMITGDHPRTAFAIARELGIAAAETEVLAGPEIEALTDEQLAARVSEISVFARVTPEHKLRIVRAWRSREAVVAMTGDGVNDAPALKAADIGIAMGKTGTDVAKEASAMVLADDNFATIVAAIEEGRAIFENIRKTLLYLLSGNFGEILVMAVAVIAGWPLPLVPIQLLWINLVTDGFPALALATDPAEPDLLRRPPRPRKAEIADRKFLGAMVATGLLDAGCTLAAFAYGLFHEHSLDKARTYAFATLVMAEVLRAFASRSRDRILWEIGAFSNLRLALVAIVIIGIQLFSHHVPFMEKFLHSGQLTWPECLGVTAVAFVPVTLLELNKLVRRLLKSAKPAGRA